MADNNNENNNEEQEQGGIFGNVINPNRNEGEDPYENDDSFFAKLTSEEIYEVTSFFFPSAIFSILIILAMAITVNPCSSFFLIALRVMLGIHIAMVIKAAVHLSFIILKKQNEATMKSILSTSSIALTVLYYAGCIICIIAYSLRADSCFAGNLLYNNY